MSTKGTVLLSGMIASQPGHGGATWAVLQYLLGLKRLGYDIYFVEPVPTSALRGVPLSESQNACYLDQVARQFDLEGRMTLLLEGTQETYGLAYADLRRIASRATVLINISGLLRDEALLSPIPVRVFLDLDPAFNQLWSAVQGIDMRFSAHTHFVTIGLAIGDSDCSVPTCGFSWIKTLQPIVLDYWPAMDTASSDLTTIGNWRAYGSIEHDGRFYGQKAHSLRDYFTLPTRTDEKFVLALGIHPNEVNDLQALQLNGWHLKDPSEVASTPDKYRDFIQSSKAEFGVAKSGYAISRCGWFSDRSICYLASGRPVIAQDTGFDRFLPTGGGLFSFNNTDDILAAIEKLNSAPEKQGRSARALAEEFFDSDKVLPRLLEQLTVSA